MVDALLAESFGDDQTLVFPDHFVAAQQATGGVALGSVLEGVSGGDVFAVTANGDVEVADIAIIVAEIPVCVMHHLGSDIIIDAEISIEALLVPHADQGIGSVVFCFFHVQGVKTPKKFPPN